MIRKSLMQESIILEYPSFNRSLIFLFHDVFPVDRLEAASITVLVHSSDGEGPASVEMK
jgi:hypothetical protein